MENLEPPPPSLTSPQIKDGKMARFCPSRGFILDVGGWGLAVPFYFVQDCSLFQALRLSRVPWIEWSANTKIKREETFFARPTFRLPFTFSFPHYLRASNRPRVASQKNNLTIEIWRKIQLRHSSPYLHRKLSDSHIQSKSIVDFDPQGKLYFYNLHSGPADQNWRRPRESYKDYKII